MSDFIRVQPTRELRTEFARTVVAADGHTRMAGGGVFLVHRDVFVQLPEALLIGALIGGTPYRTVAEGDEPATGGALPAGTMALVGEAGPETVVPVADPLAREQSPTHSGLHLCADCGKTAASAAGLKAHRRAKHETTPPATTGDGDDQTEPDSGDTTGE